MSAHGGAAARPTAWGGASLPQRTAADRAGVVLAGLGAVLAATALALVALQLVTTEERLLPVLVAGAVLGGALLAWPGWAVPAFVAVTWTSIGASYFGGLPSPIEAGALALVPIAAWRALREPALARTALALSALFGLPVLVAGLVSVDGMPEVLEVAKRVVFLPLVALCLRGMRDVERTATALTALGIVLGTGAAYSVLVGPTSLFPRGVDAEGFELLRAYGPFGEPNFFAMSMAMILPLALYHVARGGRAALLGYASAVCVLVGILATGSRGGLLAALVVLVAFAAVSGHRRLRIGTALVVVAGALAFPAFLALAGDSAERTVSGRITENLVAVAMFADHPVVGVGPAQYPVNYREYARWVGNDPRPVREPHSLPLEIAAEQGLAGLLGWLAAIVLVARAVIATGVWRSLLGKAVLLAIGAFAIESIYLHGSQLRLFFILLGALLALAVAHGRGERLPERAAAAA